MKKYPTNFGQKNTQKKAQKNKSPRPKVSKKSIKKMGFK